MSAIPPTTGSTLRSVTTSVLRMQLDQAKQQGAAEQQLIEGAGDIAKARVPAGKAPGVGMRIDVSG